MEQSILLELDEITNDVSSMVVEKEGPQLTLQSSLDGASAGNLRKKLLVLDLNGLLVDTLSKVPKGYKADARISHYAVFKRPFCDDFLQFCFERFNVGVWSAKSKKNLNLVLNFVMGKSKQNLLFCWDQSHCTDTGFTSIENKHKHIFLKELNKLWEKHDPDLPWEKGEYNESNTLLVDDSPYKALKNPIYTAIFPFPYRYDAENDNCLGPNGEIRVYLEGLALADHVQEYVKLNPFGQPPITETDSSWGLYSKVIGTTSSISQEENATDSSGCAVDNPSPLTK